MQKMTRRAMLKGTAAAAAGWAVPYFSKNRLLAETPAFEILDTRTISTQPEYYHAWPTVGVSASDELYVAVSGGREGHICPFGRVEFFRSHDKGETWSWPRTIYDSPCDDRDSGVLVTDKGTILVTSFTSYSYYDDAMKQELERRKNGNGTFSDERFEKWMAVHNSLSDEERKKELGSWIFRSTDNGINWEARRRAPVSSPHGPVQMTNGTLFYPGIDFWTDDSLPFYPGCYYWTEKSRFAVWTSADDGQNWDYLSTIPPRSGDHPRNYCEMHGVEASDGTLVVQIRNHNPNNKCETLQAESADGGKTWSELHTIGVWGYPSHLWRLADGRLLMTYGHRRVPFGNQVRISADNGKNWSEPLILTGNEVARDLGYPSTVALSDGTLVSVWYEQPVPGENSAVKMAKWILK